MRSAHLLIALAFSTLPACVSSIHVRGGPNQAQHALEASDFPKNLAPLIADSPTAQAEFARLESRTAIGTTLLYAGLGTLAGCIALPAADQSRGLGVTGVTFVGLGFCGVSAAFDVAALLVLPNFFDWGNVLTAYNAERPAAPYYSDELNVRP